jgi:hypothetical protein
MAQPMQRRGQGYKPKLIFTSDFHQLVTGDLIPGPCLLRYDPHRIVPGSEIAGLSNTQRPITAHVRFHPAGNVWVQDLRFPPASRLIVDYDPTGQGTMLETDFPLPESCPELECWFSYTDDYGTKWDSQMGANYWIRFSLHDLEIKTAQITARPTEALDLFTLAVVSVGEVDSIRVRWRYTNAINEARYEWPLEPAGLGDGKSWSLGAGAPVSSNTPLAFDLVYQANGHTYTDDNQGTWYIVSR